ncbi:MAG: cyclic-di-AMP receptor [Spirochaetaceae bacterium]|nr:cyclic-di-AMP receptor [Spirochaetaceae bacterium]
MKMILAIIHEKDEEATVELLNTKNLYVTKLATSGGFLKEKNVTLMSCVQDEQVELAISCIKSTAQSRKTVSYSFPCSSTTMINPATTPMLSKVVNVGGCTIFVMPVEQMIKN